MSNGAVAQSPWDTSSNGACTKVLKWVYNAQPGALEPASLASTLINAPGSHSVDRSSSENRFSICHRPNANKTVSLIFYGLTECIRGGMCGSSALHCQGS